MKIRGRSSIAAFMACLILLIFSAPAYPSYNSEAGRKYAVASQRLADLRKSSKKKKYRSYWVDCLRTFESVEKRFPKSPSAGDACFDRAAMYFELYQTSRYSRDIDDSMRVFAKCQASYPKHAKAPEALYRIVELSAEFKRNQPEAEKACEKLTQAYPDSTWTGKAKARLGITEKKAKPGQEIQKAPEPEIVPAKQGPPGMVTSIRYWSGGAYTRIVINQDRPIRFIGKELKKPDRLVFDLLNSRVTGSINKGPLPVNDGILKQVRASQFAPNTVRVVLDLASIKSYAAFPLHDPDRLVIDVTGEGNGQVISEAAGTGGLEAADNQPGQHQSSGEQKTGGAAPGRETVVPPVKIPDTGSKDGEKLSLSRQLGLKIRTIALDAGHGGHDPGAIGKNGLREKTVTLDIAKRLQTLVKDRLGCNVIMTRDKDVFIPLEQRPFIAKSKGADLFVSIHINATRKRKTRGIETYVQSLRASDREAMATAARENAMSTKKLSELKSELDRIFADLTRDDKIEESLYLASAVQGSLVNGLKPVNSHADDLRIKDPKRAFFYVLINTEMPSILAEVGFISNPEEEKLLKKESYRQNIAEALFEGVKKYVDARSPQMMGI